MKKQGRSLIVLLVLCISFSGFIGCSGGVHAESTALKSWSEDSSLKQEILEYIDYAKKNVPEEERIAVFDMDGTVVCEKPVWIEMNVALTHMAEMTKEHVPLLYDELFAIAYDYKKSPSASNWSRVEANVKPILMRSFLGETQEGYVKYVKQFAKSEMNPDYQIEIEKTFYKPMVELIEHLKDNGFSVYIVSGSEEGLIWGVASETLGLDRDHLIGTRIQLKADYDNPDVFIRQGDIYAPMNLGNGKSENIYYELGARPVFACGNTVDDFGMLNYTTSNEKYETMGLLVHHDSASKEYKYPINERHEEIPWEKVVDENGWHVISMENDFSSVFMK